MYSRILFAVDDDEALPAAVVAFARKSKAVVRVLHVHRIDPGVTNGASRRLVKLVIELLEAEGLDAEGEIRLMHAGEKLEEIITRAAQQPEADLVVMGTHGRSDMSALFRGSVSHAVAAGLDVPVLVVSASMVPLEPRTLLVAVDGSSTSDEVIAEAGEIASMFGATAFVLHVQRIVTADSVAIVEPDAEGLAIVERSVDALKARGVQATGQTVVSHSVAFAIVLAAERVGADLVVLGSRRPSHLGSLLMGSVAHQVMHQVRCPVLLTRRVRSADPVS